MGSIYRPPVQNYSRFRAVYVFDDCSSAEGGICDEAEGGICDEARQQPMQYCSSFEGGCL